MHQAFLLKGSMRILGVCYGHQALALFFKSVVVRRKIKGGIEKVNINKEAVERFDFLFELKDYESMLLNQHH